MAISYAIFEFQPCVFDEKDANGWVHYNTGWKPVPMSEVCQKAGMLSREMFKREFPHLPPAPIEAKP